MPEDGFAFRIDEPVVLIGFVALVLWLSGERLLQWVGLRQPTAAQRERRSWCWVSFSYFGAVVFALLDATVFHWSTVGPRLASMRWIGVPFLAAGIVVRMVSRLTLGKQFSGHVQTAAEHRLVTTGIYGSVQHPAYLGYLCLLLGFPLCFGSMAGFACAVLLGVPAILYRIRIEESALQRWFPDEYPPYQRRTYRLIPRVW